jgi:hypothetical protein
MMVLKRQLFIILCAVAWLMPASVSVLHAQTTAIQLTIQPATFPAEISWELRDGSNALVASRACGFYTSVAPDVLSLDLNNGETYTFRAFDDWGDGWNGGSYSLTQASSGCLIRSGSPDNLLDGDELDNCISQLEEEFTFQPNVILGCTDPAAPNFNPCATLNDGSCLLPILNDDCANAALISGPGTLTAVSIGAAATVPDPSSCTFQDTVDVWFRYTVPAGLDTLWIYTCSSTFDTALSLWDDCPGSGGSELQCNDDGIRPGVGSGTSACGLNPLSGGSSLRQSALSLSGSELAALVGSAVWIRYAGFNGAEGFGELVLEEVEASSACNPEVLPSGQNHTVLATRVQLNWTPTPGAVACQVQGKRLPSGPQPIRDVTIPPFNETNVPFSAAGAGTTWTWRVRCACQISPIIATAFTTFGDTFSIPAAREAGLLPLAEAPFPIPAASELWVPLLPGEEGPDLALQVYDLAGRLVLSESAVGSAGLQTYRLGIGSLPEGMYLLELKNQNKFRTLPFTVAR